MRSAPACEARLALRQQASELRSFEVGFTMFEPLTRKLLILDLDETLIHVPDAPFAHPCDFLVGNGHVYKRPGVDHFLEICQDWFDVAVWSSASPMYISSAVEHLFHEKQPPVFVWDERRCTRRRHPETDVIVWHKTLAKVERLGYPSASVIAVDDSPEKWGGSYGNLVRVTPFLGDSEDDELSALSAYLDLLRREENIRAVEKRGWRHRMIHPKDTAKP